MKSSGRMKITYGGGSVPPQAKALSEAGSVGHSQSFGGWLPRLGAPNADHQFGRRDAAVARARDLQSNDPLISGGVDKMVGMICGQTGLRFSSAPDHVTLGITADEASDLGQTIERIWNLWANDPLKRCDYEREETFGGLSSMLAGHKIGADGEGFAVLRWDDEPLHGFPFRTSVHIVDPDRLSNPNGMMDREWMKAGIETDGRSPIAYHFRDAHPEDFSLGANPNRWTRVPREEPWGRPIVLHYRQKRRAGELRGWSKLMSTLQLSKGLSRYGKSEIEANALRSMMTAVLRTDTPGDAEMALNIDDMSKLNEARNAAYGEDGVRFADGAKVLSLYPTDSMEFLGLEHKGQDFEAFFRVFARSIAAGIGMSYEQFTMDFSQSNYSSMRAALLDVYRGIANEQELKVQKVNAPLLLAILEDAVTSGMLTLPPQCPDLYECPAAYTAGRWLGPAKGWVDPVKEALGAVARIENGLSTLEKETAEQGGDWRETTIQRARETKFIEESGAPLPPSYAEQEHTLGQDEDGDPIHKPGQRPALPAP